MKKVIFYLSVIFFTSCTKDYWDTFDWGFHGKIKEEEKEEYWGGDIEEILEPEEENLGGGALPGISGDSCSKEDYHF